MMAEVVEEAFAIVVREKQGEPDDEFIEPFDKEKKK